MKDRLYWIQIRRVTRAIHAGEAIRWQEKSGDKIVLLSQIMRQFPSYVTQLPLVSRVLPSVLYSMAMRFEGGLTLDFLEGLMGQGNTLGDVLEESYRGRYNRLRIFFTMPPFPPSQAWQSLNRRVNIPLIGYGQERMLPYLMTQRVRSIRRSCSRSVKIWLVKAPSPYASIEVPTRGRELKRTIKLPPRSWEPPLHDYGTLSRWLKNRLLIQDIDSEEMPGDLFCLNSAQLETLPASIRRAGHELVRRWQDDPAEVLGDKSWLELFQEVFFQRDKVEQRLDFLRRASIHEVSTRRLKSLDRAHTLAYIIRFSDSNLHPDQLIQASRLAHAALATWVDPHGFKSLPLNPQNRLHGSSYSGFFTLGLSLDESGEIEVFDNYSSDCIGVLHRGHAYLIKVIEQSGLVSECALRASMKGIVSSAAAMPRQNLGALTSASASLRRAAHAGLDRMTRMNMERLSKALFIMCLDDGDEPLSTRELFTIKSMNRYFYNTQLVVGPFGESAAILSYLYMAGTPAIELLDAVWRRSLDSREVDREVVPATWEHLRMTVDSFVVRPLWAGVESLFHCNRVVWDIDFGVNWFTRVNLSPNHAVNFAIMLSLKEMEGRYPVVSHAISRRMNCNPASQIDWCYVSFEMLDRFYRQFKETGISAYSSLMFMQAHKEHQSIIEATRAGMGPSSFVTKPKGEFYEDLAKRFIVLGQKHPALRKYLFGAYRTDASIDVVTSMLRVPDSVTIIGRPGTYSDLFSKFGLHILINSEKMRWVFIPNARWVTHLKSLVIRSIHWLKVMHSLARTHDPVRADSLRKTGVRAATHTSRTKAMIRSRASSARP